MKIKDLEFNCSPDTILLRQFEQMSIILNQEDKDAIEKYEEIFKSFGVTDDVLNEMTVAEFGKAIKDFVEESQKNNDVFVKEFDIDGYTYKAFDTLKVKDLRIISKYQTSVRYAGEMMAICFKRTDLSDVEHYADAHIRHKAQLFRDKLTADICIPYIVKVTELMVKGLSLGNEDTAKLD
jgi:hypothetical protein